MSDLDPYEDYVENVTTVKLPMFKISNSKFTRFKNAFTKLGHIIKFGGLMGFITGVVTGTMTYKSHKSMTVIVGSGVGMAFFIAALMTAGQFISILQPINSFNVNSSYLRTLNLETDIETVDAMPFWVNDNFMKERV